MWKSFILCALLISGCAATNTKSMPSEPARKPSDETSTTALQIPASKLTDADIDSIVSGSQALGVDLYKRITADTDGNIIISPLSISSAFGLAYAGSNGQTRLDMARVLNFELSDDRIHRALGQVQNITEDDTQGQFFDVANTIFFDKVAILAPEYISLIKDSYRADPQKVDYQKNLEKAVVTINKWVEEQTRGLIPETLTLDNVSKDTRSVMVNTAYLKADWLEKFDAVNTMDGSFFGPNGDIIVPLMNMTQELKLVDGRDFKALELPYQNKTMSAIVFLPDTKTGLEDFEEKLSGENLSKWFRKFETEKLRNVKVTLPKVDLDFTANKITDHIIALGMSLAFSNYADFGGRVSNDVTKLDEVIHKTVLKIDEEGTEAAAVTAISEVIVTGRRYQDDPEVFRVDHPFFLVIKNNKTNAVLFMGRIVDPMPESDG